MIQEVEDFTKTYLFLPALVISFEERLWNFRAFPWKM